MSDIADIFARDPNNCSKQDIQALVTYYRSKAAQFKLGNMTAGSSKPRAVSAKDAEAIDVVKKLDLGDLL